MEQKQIQQARGQIIFTDGSSSKIGKSVYCVLFQKKPNQRGKPKKHLEYFEEFMTSFDIEFLGLKHAVEVCTKNSIIYTDAMALISYLKNMKDRKLKDDEIKLMNLIKKKNLKIYYIPRHMNEAGIYLENRISKLRGYCNSAVKRR